jgi:transcriptional regulator with XRE-family HTH domain
MTTRESPAQRGSRLARRLLIRVGEELRIARVSAGLSSRTVGASVGISHTQVLRIERAMAPHIDLGILARHAAVLGCDLSIAIHPAATPIRDAAHVALLDRLHARLARTLVWTTEVPMPIAGDRRSADATIRGAGVDAFVEAETRLDDLQAVIRRVNAKQRDLGQPRAILLLSDTRHHRAVLRAASSLMERFPVDTRHALAALERGRDPGGDCLVIL